MLQTLRGEAWRWPVRSRLLLAALAMCGHHKPQGGSSIDTGRRPATPHQVSILDTPILVTCIIGCKYWFKDKEFSSLFRAYLRAD